MERYAVAHGGGSVPGNRAIAETRVRCSAVRESGSCSNRRILYVRDVENLVLSDMAEELKDPRLIEIYVRNYNRERERLAGDAAATRTRLEAKRDRIEGERQRNIDLVIRYISSEEDARQRIAELNEGRQRVEAERAALEVATIPVALHPAALDRHVATVDALAERMAGHASADDDRGTLIDDFRALVHGVAVHPKGPREGFETEVKGKLAALLGGDVFPEARYNSGSRVVAGVRYIARPTISEALFSCRRAAQMPMNKSKSRGPRHQFLRSVERIPGLVVASRWVKANA
ncbi:MULTISPECIES: hypothetical protein [unclassified Bradyrhizobium]|uniref:hypothetical protein n=1 Tax=unclassified Bradyrhizobium TaxID=2631580 RepID=UPI0028E59CD0|nr:MULTISPECIES: hypothetical protein [unclassified Bradyrhizobium]